MNARILGAVAIGGLALAAVTLTGCAPKGTETSAYGQAAAPNATIPYSMPSPVASPTPVTPPIGSQTSALKSATIPKMGKVVTDQNGFVLYRFDKDSAKPSKATCNDKCAKVWQPALTDGLPQLSGIDPNLVGTVIRDDGSMQLTLKGWPLYHYLGDVKAGTWKGQNVGRTWFVAAPTGAKNLTCVPEPPPAAVTPPPDGNPAPPKTNPTTPAGHATPTPTSDPGGDYGTGGY